MNERRFPGVDKPLVLKLERRVWIGRLFGGGESEVWVLQRWDPLLGRDSLGAAPDGEEGRGEIEVSHRRKSTADEKKIKGLKDKIVDIENLEERIEPRESLSKGERKMIGSKAMLQAELNALEKESCG